MSKHLVPFIAFAVAVVAIALAAIFSIRGAHTKIVYRAPLLQGGLLLGRPDAYADAQHVASYFSQQGAPQKCSVYQSVTTHGILILVCS